MKRCIICTFSFFIKLMLTNVNKKDEKRNYLKVKYFIYIQMENL